MATEDAASAASQDQNDRELRHLFEALATHWQPHAAAAHAGQTESLRIAADVQAGTFIPFIRPNLTCESAMPLIEARRRALQSALKGSAPAAGAETPHDLLRSVEEKTISILSGAGGAGRTTVLATLARVLSSAGERILLVDGDVDTLLPYYFGASSVRSSSRRFAARHRSGAAPVHVLSGGCRDDAGGWFARELARLRTEVDRVLVDAWPGISPSCETLVPAGGTCLGVLVPDLASVAGIQRVMRQLREFERSMGHSPSVHFLLNRYNEQSPLHRATRDWLTEQLGDRLLPIVIRESERVTEALAEGMTVVDYAPSSLVVADFEHLADWIRSYPKRIGRHSHDRLSGECDGAD